jgi:hypothetical protein
LEVRKITLLNETATERQTKVRLEQILLKYQSKLSNWIFREEIFIQDEGYSHSHPDLTFTSNQLLSRDDNEILSIFVHENLHCFFDLRADAYRSVMNEVRQRYPKVPVARVNGVHVGAHDEESSYIHIVVCFLEHFALRNIIGRSQADQTLAKHDYYTGIYEIVRNDFEYLKGVIIEKYDLNPLTLRR